MRYSHAPADSRKPVDIGTNQPPDPGEPVDIGTNRPDRTGLIKARNRSEKVDELVQKLLVTAGGDDQKVALVALGGYGRRELSPQSDIDLLILYRKRGKQSVDQLANQILYPLWDEGFHVGHSVKTVSQSARDASLDIESLTSYLDARFLAGDFELFNRFLSGIRRQATTRRGTTFLNTLKARTQERHKRFGDTACLLEPNIKESCGGLRDIHNIIWIGKALFGVSRIADLGATKYLSDTNIESLNRAHEFIATVRNHLHNLSSRTLDDLFFEYQRGVADAMGYARTDRELAVEQFMRDYYLHASDVEFIHALFWQQLEHEYLKPSRPTRLICQAGGDSCKSRPEFCLELFSRAVSQGCDVPPDAIKEIEEFLGETKGPFVWTGKALEEFFSILSSGDSSLAALETMLHLGLLQFLIPEFAFARCRAQHDVYHRYTLDGHAIHTVAELGKTGQKSSSSEFEQTLCEELEDMNLVLLAGLIHDLGKGRGGDHAAKGSKMARSMCQRMGLPDQAADEVSFLVRNHLLLAETATRRDLNDDSVILKASTKIGSLDRLKKLYVLTVADGLATGPEAWTHWKATLVKELFFKVKHELEGEDEKKSLALIAKRRSHVKALLDKRFLSSEVEYFLNRMPDAYVLSNEAPAIVSHFALLRDLPAGELGTLVEEQTGQIHTFVLATEANPSLFYKVAGALALHGMNILSGDVFTTGDGLALAVFQTHHYFEGPIETAKWQAVERDIKLALKGKISLDYRLAEKIRYYPHNDELPGRTPRVTIDNFASGCFTVIELRAKDRIGLLYTVTKALFDLSLDLRMAKVSTGPDGVVDVFYVSDLNGQKLEDDVQMQDVERTIILHLQRWQSA